jgi:ABC-type lipoprotein export system ATPase subunit
VIENECMFLRLKQISKSYFSKGVLVREVLSKLSLEVKEGESVAIVGPSGSGKTTLLNIIGTLDRPDEGKVLYKEKDVSLFNNKQLASFRSRQIGFIFQQHYLLPQCTLWENILVPTLPIKDHDWKNQCIQRGEELLKRTGIWEQRHQKPGELSGGECQRAAVVRALINAPSLLLADVLFETNQSDRVTLIMVTHDPSLAARANRIFLLKEGQLESHQGNPRLS